MRPRIHFVTLGVEDLAAQRRFYERLGLEAAHHSNDNVAFFQMGPMVLSLFPRARLAEDAGVPPEGSGFRGFTLAHNVAERSDVAALLTEAQAAGGRLVKPAQDTFWGGHSGYFADPEGNLWEVAWNPFGHLTEDGAFIM
jgi:catechol 2,3-dioxygenase-like lactoylglutathione lyase family enzyme